MEYRSLTDCLMTLKGSQGAKAAMFELAVDGPIARLTLDRPQTRNALRLDDWRVLIALVEQASRLKARVLLIESKVAGAFSAGIDLGDLAQLHGDPALRLPFRNTMRAALDGIRRAPIPVVAAIDGACLGMGVALAAACDLRIAGPQASFALPLARQGMAYPLEDIARLTGLVGEGQAARLLLTGTRIDAAEAVRIGLADMAGADPRAVADAIAGNAPGALALLKQGLGLAAAGAASDEGHARAFDATFASAEFAEGLAARQARRAPDFSR